MGPQLRTSTQSFAEAPPAPVPPSRDFLRAALPKYYRRVYSSPVSVIRIVNARQHNLKGVTVDLPHRAFIVVTGPSGSGKSSLAFDTIYAEGQRRYSESLSTYAKQFLDRMPKPLVDRLEGLAPSIAIEQQAPTMSSRSTVGSARSAAPRSSAR